MKSMHIIAVPAGNQEVTITFNFVSKYTVFHCSLPVITCFEWHSLNINCFKFRLQSTILDSKRNMLAMKDEKGEGN